ncbi:MAG: DUF4139 domain-containing protein [Bacteroidia bacterium]
MKTSILIILLSMPAFLFAQEQVQEVSSDIDHVELYTQGAQVTRLATSPLEAGITRLVFTGITSQLDPTSIRVKARNEVLILAVAGSTAIHSNPKKAPIIRMLEDSLALLRYELDMEKNTRFVLEQQESLILSNKELKGDKGLVLIDLEDALIIYQKQLAQIKQGQLDSRIREQKLQDRIYHTEAQLAEFRKSNQVPTYEVVVTVSVPTAKKMEHFELEYFVQGAAWVPSYDIRVKELTGPIQLQYKADIYNNSGENWDNVKLSLSSASPNLGGLPPVLNNQLLYFAEPYGYDKKPAPSEQYGFFKQELEVSSYTFDVGITQKNTSFSFDIPTRIKVVANNQAQKVALVDHELKGIFEHFTVPKLEEEAFLISKITGWEDLNLLIGTGNIYFEGTYLGQTSIDPTITTDTLVISLGRDKGVVVQREKLTEFCSSNFTGSKKVEILVYEITLRNTKKEDVNIRVEDQLPLSSNKEINVEATEISGAVYDEVTGKLTWQKNIPAGTTIKIRVAYEVKYPKDKVVIGL